MYEKVYSLVVACITMLFSFNALCQVVNGSFDRPGSPWAWSVASVQAGAFSSCANASYTQGGARLGGATEAPADGYVAIVSLGNRGDVGGVNLCGRVSQTFVVPVAAKLSFAYKIGDIFQPAYTPRTFRDGSLYVTVRDLATGQVESLASYNGANKEDQTCSVSRTCPRFVQVSDIDFSKYAGKQVELTFSGYTSSFVNSIGELTAVPSEVYLDNVYVR